MNIDLGSYIYATNKKLGEGAFGQVFKGIQFCKRILNLEHGSCGSKTNK
jgi:hypothetical protein